MSELLKARTQMSCGCYYVGTYEGHVGGTGYATAPDGRTLCYGHAVESEREDMRTADRFTAYLSGDHRHVIAWPGKVYGPLGKVTYYNVDRGRSSNYGIVHRCYVRVVDVHGNEWTGTGPVENGDYVSLRRVKS